MDSVYTDTQGTFGFHQLLPNSYYISINDEHYQPVREKADIQSVSLAPIVHMNISLVPKSAAKTDASVPSKPPGSNPEITDVREYTERFPKRAVKEFSKGVQADRQGKVDDAIRHYQKAVQLAPAFYAAHNNMGSDYLGKSDFRSARGEFEQVLRLNQSDAAAYFNLSNVSILTGQLDEAQQFLGEGLRRQPDSALGQFLLGTLDIRLNKLPEAERALRQSMQLDPVMMQSRLQLVNLFVREGRKDDAVTQLHDFLSAFPGSPMGKQAKDLLQRLEMPAKVPGVAPQ